MCVITAITALASAAGGGAAAAGIGGLTSLIGTGMSIFGSLQQGKAASAQADYQTKQSLILKEDALKRGAEAEQRQRRTNAALEGRQVATLSASGIEVNSGSALQILGDTAQIGELDVQNIRSNTQREAAGHQQSADIAQFEGENAKRASYVDAFGSALGGVSSVAGKWGKAFGIGGGGDFGHSSVDGRIGALF